MKMGLKLRTIGIKLLYLGVFCVMIISISNTLLTDLQKRNEEDVQDIRAQHESVSIEAKNQAFKQDLYINNKVVPLGKKVGHWEQIEDVIGLEKYSRATVLATGYTAGIESTGKTSEHPGYGITYSGVEVKRDLYSTIAADLDVYPIGTIMYIPDYGYGVVADKGSAITGDKIDLYYQTVEDVYNFWGKKEVDVYIIKMGEGNLTENELTQLNENETMQVFREQLLSK